MHLFLIYFLVQSAEAGTCTKYAFKGYTYQKTAGGEDEYKDPADKVTLRVKCFPLKKKYEDIIADLSKESSVRNTQGDAVYFEFNAHGIYERIYVASRTPVVQLTFSTRRRNRRLLNTTQELVEKYYRKTKITFPK